MTTSDFKNISDDIPKRPGVYRFYDAEDSVLYVGKAKNLKNRLNSYFGSKKHQAFKTKTMVKHASRIEYTIVDTEHDALLLENTLIKKYQPRYNVMLKDGKSYSYICVKKERFPRVFFTRKVIRDGSTYFGPYTSKHKANILLDLIKKLFPLRTCTLHLTEENIQAGKFKVCLEYHIENCLGPCEALEDEEDYNARVVQVKNILRGHYSQVKQFIKERMNFYAQNLDFEKAQAYKEKLDIFDYYQAKSTVVSTTIKDIDIFSITKDEKLAFVNFIKVVDGAIIHTNTIELQNNLNTKKQDLLVFAIQHLREKYNSVAPEIVLPFKINNIFDDVKLTVPQRGDKKKLLEMSEKNVHYFQLQSRKDAVSRMNRKSPAERILKTLQADLNMQDVPFHIECFDNSNMQGSNPVASCVVFKNAKPSKKDYRHYKIKTVEGPNDFASMTEVVGRRYKRLLEEGKDLPQLIIIDGGKGQLSSAVKSLEELGLMDKITIIGIAKRLEEIFFPNDPVPIYINKKSESLKLIQQARNEAHRFAINFHRDLRSKNFLTSSLTDIPGVGEKTMQKLIKKFGSVQKIKQTDYEEIENLVGKKLAEKIHQYFTPG